MNEFDKISEDLFNKIRGRFPNVTIGDAAGNVTNQPEVARFFDFDYNGLGNVSVSIDEDDGLTIIYSKEFISNEDTLAKQDWYSFLKELRYFAKKRMLDYSVRDITKSNLQKRDYRFLAKTSGEEKMTESKLYGTSRISYQKVGEARIVIKHTEGINQESATGRTQKIGKIYIESADGERFRYPFKHLSGARAMARHVAEGGNTYDDFGKHIVGLSEEMAKLRKFKNYMGRSAVMAESLAEYNDAVKERISTVKKTIASLQKPAYYAEAFASFETPMMEDVPEDVKENWIDELTIKQFNEELADVFPYIYKLVSEATKAQELGPKELVGEASKGIEAMKKAGNAKAGAEEKDGHDNMATAIKKKTKEEIELEQGFEEMMGQFAEGDMKWKQTSMSPEEAVAKYGKEHVKVKKGGLNNGDDMVSVHVADESFDPQSEPSKQDMMADEFMTAYEKGGEPALATAMGISDQELDQEITEYGMEHGLHADDDRDDIIQGVIEQMIDNMDEGNAYAHAVKKAKDSGKKKGDEIDGPDGEKIKLEKEEQKTPLGEFILSYFDRETGQFPKGETAVLTMVEKDYGENYITPAKQFIEEINNKVAEVMGYKEQEDEIQSPELSRIRDLAGL